MPVHRNKEDILKEVLTIFSKHLETSSQRKTRERLAILEEIYSRTDHFDAEAQFLRQGTGDRPHGARHDGRQRHL